MSDDALESRLRQHFEASIEAKRQTLAAVMPALVRAGQLLAERLSQGRRVFACGNGGSAADAQHFAAELTGRFERERPGLAGIALTTDTSALTAIANDYGYDRVFARQLEALAGADDVLLAISTSGNSPSIVQAVTAAHRAGAAVIALTGRDGGQLARALKGRDVELRAAAESTARIQEVHILFLHCLCDAIDELLDRR